MPPTDNHQTPPQIRRTAAAGEQEQEQQLECPRCESRNTKFCYYNNYNFSQPRHFCKSCRRYWTHGGTLRDIPVGGGTRKNAKRSRLAPCPDAAKLGPPPPPSFTSLLASSPAPGFLALGGFGLGLGLDDVGFGLARGLWASFPAGDPLGPGPNGSGPATRIGIGSAAWQFESAAAAVAPTAGDFCSWAEPVISTPSTGFK